MASTPVKFTASSLLRARPFASSVASSSRFFNTEAFQYVQTNSNDECILKCDEGCSTVAQAAINLSFSPRLSPIMNLARLLNTSDELIGFSDWPKKFPRWAAVETVETLCILRNMTGSGNIRKFYGEEYVTKEEMAAIYENNGKESVLKSELTSETEIYKVGVNESVSNKEIRSRALRPFIDLMRGVKSEPCEYYYHVMHGGEEIKSFADSILGTGTGRTGANLRVCSVLQNPKALYIVVGVEAQDVYGGYVYEIFVDDSLYNIRDVGQGMDHTSGIWMMGIPKMIEGEQTKRISGNLIFYREEKVCKPTLWQR